MGEDSIIIIGAGVAGLSAGCYARMNGFDTTMFEMHDKPGGVCTSWKRKGYTFDGCIHWLVGSRAGSDYNRITIRHYCYDPTMAPEGKSALVVYLESDYDYWKALRADRKRYKAEKEDVASKVIAAISSRHAGFAEQVEVVDVATPATYERYTGNWRGSFEGFLLTTRTSKYMIKGMKRELPGLRNFYMIGQWLSPGGGLPPAAQHGREIIQLICARDGRPFVARES